MAEALLITVGCIVLAVALGLFRYGEQWMVSLRRRSGVGDWMDTTRIARYDRVMAISIGLWFLFGGSLFVVVGVAMASR